MDVLQVLPLDDWEKLRESLRRDWPKYLSHYRWVDNALRWKRKDTRVKINIYCPEGKIESGVFFGVATYAMRFLIVFAFDEATDLLNEILVKTKIIQWNRMIVMSPGFEGLLDEFFKSNGIVVKEKTIANYRFKSKQQCSQAEIQLAEGYELRELNASHVRLIHSLWPHNNNEGSMSFVEMVLSLNGGIGLFSKIDDKDEDNDDASCQQLVSWVAQTDFGGLGLLQTVDSHRLKGYAKLVVQALAKRIADQLDLDSISFVVDGNQSSNKLFDSLGFECLGKVAWYIL